jgi:hypothetical protein
VSGAVNDSGARFAQGVGRLVQITDGAVVNGGVAKVGNGVVEIAGSSGEDVVFQAKGSGGLLLDGLGSAYTGKISGFGGANHANHKQYIDFLAGRLPARP